MLKRISSLLFVGIVGYTLGTMSTIYAEKAVVKESRTTSKSLVIKLDKVIANQKAMHEKLKQIWFKVK